MTWFITHTNHLQTDYPQNIWQFSSNLNKPAPTVAISTPATRLLRVLTSQSMFSDIIFLIRVSGHSHWTTSFLRPLVPITHCFEPIMVCNTNCLLRWWRTKPIHHFPSWKTEFIATCFNEIPPMCQLFIMLYNRACHHHWHLNKSHLTNLNRHFCEKPKQFSTHDYRHNMANNRYTRYPSKIPMSYL